MEVREDWHSVLCVEEVWTGDGRFYEAGAFTWAPLPLPFMADDENNDAHLNAKLVANIVRIERVGNEVHGWMQKVDPTTMGADADRVMHLQGLIDTNQLRGVSVDMDSPDFTVEMPMDMNDRYDEEMDVVLFDVNSETMSREVYHSMRIIGATALPFPAFQEAFVEAMAASFRAGLEVMTPDLGMAPPGVTGWMLCDCGPEALIASITPPMHPSRSWFTASLTEETAPVVTDQGAFYGHLAAHGSCHIGFGDRCVTPPLSRTGYAEFMRGELVTAERSRVRIGTITLGTGHADITLDAAAAVAHYDNTGTVVADVAVGEDQWGIWFAGALRPDITPLQVRQLMAADVSGDWRAVNGHLELVAILAVNVPGFMKKRPTMHVREDEFGMVASMTARLPILPHRAARAEVVLPPEMKRTLASALAQSIGRDPASRRRRLAEQVRR